MPSKYGFGNTRKKSPYKMGKAHYGKDQKNPIMLTKEGKEKIMASDANPEFKKAIANSPVDMKSDSPMYMHGKKSPAKKYKSDDQRKAVHASKAEKSPAKQKVDPFKMNQAWKDSSHAKNPVTPGIMGVISSGANIIKDKSHKLRKELNVLHKKWENKLKGKGFQYEHEKKKLGYELDEKGYKKNPIEQRDPRQTLHSKPAKVKPGYTPL